MSERREIWAIGGFGTALPLTAEEYEFAGSTKFREVLPGDEPIHKAFSRCVDENIRLKAAIDTACERLSQWDRTSRLIEVIEGDLREALAGVSDG